MKEQLISFDTAKLAKEKGFDIPCQWAFGKNGEEPINFNEYHYEFSLDKLIHGDNFNFYKGVYRNISAPTQSLLQKWLRETFNINIIVIQVELDKYMPCVLTQSNMKSIIDGDCTIYDFIDMSYSGSSIFEEALEEGLKKAIKLLKQ